MAKKTIDDFIEKGIKEMGLKERAIKFEEEAKPLMEKWGVIPWAGIQSNNEMIACVPMYKDLFDAVQPS